MAEIDGGGQRLNAGKAQLHLLSPEMLRGTAAVMEYGAKKYAAWNWARGMPWSTPYDCALRHLLAWFEGEEMDPESGLPHLDHVACNIMMLQHYRKHYPQGDDRPEILRPAAP